MAYDVNTDLIRGDRFFIYLADEAEPIAFSTTVSLETSLETIDTTNKMSGNFTSVLAGQASWSLSTDALQSINDEHVSTDLIFDKYVAREAVFVTFSAATGATYAKDTTITSYSGYAYITSFNISADNQSVSTMSVTLTGSGELTRTAGVPTP